MKRNATESYVARSSFHWKTRLWRSRKPECPTAVLGDRTPIPCPDSSGSSPTGQARQSPQRRTAPDVAPEASHPPTAAERSQSRGQSCGNCSKACHPVRKKGRINAKILPNPAKSDRLLDRANARLDAVRECSRVQRELFGAG